MALITSHPLAVQSYQPHGLHTDSDYPWPEHNCYVDLFIELLHSLRCDPIACFYVALCADFQGDQWTFVKPDVWALWKLYGVRVFEVNVWHMVESHVIYQLRDHSVPLLEVDAFYLPDVAGISYQLDHTKTAIGIVGIDVAAQELWYFHNRGLHCASGADYRGLLGIDPRPQLVPYFESASVGAACVRSYADLRHDSLELLRESLTATSVRDPFGCFERHLADSLPAMAQGDLGFHRYSFATFRQLGAACSLGVQYLSWCGLPNMGRAIEGLALVSSLSQAFILRLARAATRGREVDWQEPLACMRTAWQTARDSLGDAIEQPACC